jgi:hypothetical protein
MLCSLCKQNGFISDSTTDNGETAKEPDSAANEVVVDDDIVEIEVEMTESRKRPAEETKPRTEPETVDIADDDDVPPITKKAKIVDEAESDDDIVCLD